MNVLERIVLLREERHWTEYQLAEHSGLTHLQYPHGTVKICCHPFLPLLKYVMPLALHSPNSF